MRQLYAIGKLATFVCLLVSSVVLGASAQSVVDPTKLSAETIQRERALVEDDARLAADIQSGALDFYDRALLDIDAAAAVASEAATLEAMLASASERIAALRKRLDTPAAPVAEVTIPADVTLEGLQTLANQRRAESRVVREKLQEREDALAKLSAAGTTYSDQLAEREQQLRRTVEDLQAASVSKEPSLLVDARKTFLYARQRLQEGDIDFIRRGLGSYDTLVQLYTLERDAVAAELAMLEPQLVALDARLQERRAREARAATAEAVEIQASTAALPRPVAELAEENTRLRAEVEELTRAESGVAKRLRTTEKSLARIESDLTTTRERVNAVGPSEAIGRLLRRRLQRLPSLEDYRRVENKRQGEIHRAADRRIDIEETLADFDDTDQRVEAILASLGQELDRFDGDHVRAQTAKLVREKRDTREKLQQEYGRYLTQLATLDVTERRLVAAVRETAKFIKEQLFWIKSLPLFSFRDLIGLPTGLGWFGSLENWERMREDVATELAAHPVSSILAILAIIGIFYLRTQAGSRLALLAVQTRQIRTDSFAHTAKAMLYTLIAASAWPLLMAVTGWHIRADPIGTPYSSAIGQGLMISARYLFILSFWWWVLHPEGLGHRHFRWALPVTADLSKQLRWLSWVLIPTVFVVSSTNEFGEVDTINALGRPTLVIAMLAVAVFFWRGFNATSPCAEHILGNRPDSWLARLRLVWFPLSLAIPLAIAVASLLGYYYTAHELTRLLLTTIWYLVGLWILSDVLLRWFYIAERRLRLQAAIRRRDEMRAHAQDEELAESEGFEIEVPEVDYKSLGEQGRMIVQVGILFGAVLALGLLWGDLLPVLGFLSDAALPFNRNEIVDGVPQVVPVTVADLGFALLVISGALFAAKNLAGLLEFALLSRLRLDAGGRYAVVTLFQYLIVTVGVTVSLSTVGLQWSKLQWLVAALGVGLGFGLQEIVANFVSGIILLLERPIRIGDTVTVGDTTGRVARIQIRAATIITFERKELLVPNKEFITGRVLNWTLSNEQIRILINVGVAYGSDVDKAMDLLLQAATEHERILDEPRPVVTFEAFGDNALSLFLRAYTDSLDNRLMTTTELHQSIYAKLNQAGISIAFPQRDVHLDTSKPLEIKVRHEPPDDNRER